MVSLRRGAGASAWLGASLSRHCRTSTQRHMVATLRRLTLALSGWPLASPLEGRVRRTILREAEVACRAERGEQPMLALKLLTHNRQSLSATNKERGN